MNQLINASAHKTGIESGSVHAVITSPPYWGLRKYAGDQGIEWESVAYAPMAGLPEIEIPAMQCGLGEEPTPEAYIGHLILVMREMWRVLRSDGTAWVNLGDSYNGSGGPGSQYDNKASNGMKGTFTKYTNANKKQEHLKPKDIVMIPARFALAAQADGWYLRSDIIWSKPNPMPESVTDRPTKAHEYIYLLAKSQSYFYDAEAIKEPSGGHNGLAASFKRETKEQLIPKQTNIQHRIDRDDRVDTGSRNKRSVWNVATQSYSGSHFATWPEKLAEVMVLASTSAHGSCSKCGSPWERIMEKVGEAQQRWAKGASVIDAAYNGQVGESSVLKTGNVAIRQTVGWQPTCTCNADTVPATVLDCFNGSGTTGRVANRLGRKYIGVDISDEYLTKLAPERLSNIQYQMSL